MDGEELSNEKGAAKQLLDCALCFTLSWEVCRGLHRGHNWPYSRPYSRRG
jgi:hypothetical protein